MKPYLTLKAVYTPMDERAPKAFTVLLKGGPMDGQRVGVDSLAKWIEIPVVREDGIGTIRYRRDPSADGVEPVYVFANEH